jgi:ribosomal protein S8
MQFSHAQETEKTIAIYKGGQEKLFSDLTKNINKEDLLELLGDKKWQEFTIRLVINTEGKAYALGFYQLKNVGMRNTLQHTLSELEKWKPAMLNKQKVEDVVSVPFCVSIDANNQPILSLNTINLLPKKEKETVTKKGGFIDSWPAFNKQFFNRFRKPDVPKNIKKLKAIIQITVNKEGRLIDVDIIQDPGYGIYEEINRLFQLEEFMQWIPKEIDGKPVETTFTIPITIIY